jgi:hypothetical protein
LKASSTAKKADAVAKEERKQKWSAANAGPDYMWCVCRHPFDGQHLVINEDQLFVLIK